MDRVTVTLEWTPVGHNGMGTMIAKAGDQVLHMDKLDLPKAKARSAFVEQVCIDRPGINRRELEDRLLAQAVAQPQAIKDKKTGLSERDRLLAEYDQRVVKALAGMLPEIQAEAATMLENPDLMDTIAKDIMALGVVGERDLAGSAYATATSRQSADPMSAIVQGATSTGKSFVIERVAQLIPPEAKLVATDMSAMSLYYLPPGSLLHRFVVAGERARAQTDEHADARKALREMLSGGELSKAIPIRGDNGEMVTKVFHQYGPIAHIESTSATSLFDEDSNRSLMLSTDESEEQTTLVVDAIAHGAMKADGIVDTAPTIARHHALQRMLKRVYVVIPYAEHVISKMPKGKPEARRASKQLFGMIKAIATLHQRQRAEGPIKHGDLIQASVHDYFHARQLLIVPMDRTLGRTLPTAVARFAQRLVRYKNTSFTTTEARRDDPIVSHKSKVCEYLNTLADAGVVEIVDEGRGNKPHTWRVIGEVPTGGSHWLPTEGLVLHARQLLIVPMDRTLGRTLPTAVARFAQRLVRYKNTSFTTTEARRDDPIVSHKSKVCEYLNTLADAGVVEIVDEGRGNKPHTWRVIGEVPTGGSHWLPTEGFDKWK